MGKPDPSTQSTVNQFKIGDIVPVSNYEMLDIFYLVKVGNEKLLINKEGVVFLKSLESGRGPVGTEQEKKMLASLLGDNPHGQHGQDKAVELTCQPGSAAYSQAEQIVHAFLGHFMNHLRNEFRIISIKFSKILKDNGQPLVKYLAREHGGLPGLKAYLIREFFTHTIIEERGLNILFFLTIVLALKEDGLLADQSLLTQEQKKETLIDFLNFVRNLGADAEKKVIFEKTYSDFIDQEYALLLKEGGTGFYINSSFLKAMKAQKDFLLKESNRNYLENKFRSAIRLQREVVQTYMLSYLKGMVILRLHSHSRKEQRGRNEDEREKFLYDIIAYQKEPQ